MTDEIKLYCAVYGDGSMFPITIARGAQVSALQEAIFAKKRYAESYRFDANELTLYLARDATGRWLVSDATLKPLLKQGRREDSDYVEMIPIRKIDAYFNDFHPGESEIHILVELPDTAAPTTQAPLTIDDLRMVLAENAKSRTPEYSISTCTHTRANKLLLEMGYQYQFIDVTEDDEDETSGAVLPFDWEGTVAEDQTDQRARYMDYIRRNLQGFVHQAAASSSTKKQGTRSSARNQPKYYLKDTAQMKNLLYCDASDVLPFKVKGTTDMMIIDKAAEILENVFVGLYMVIKVRQKDWGPDAQSQLLLELVTASLKSDLQCTPVALLTNLTDYWYFAWIAPDRKIVRLAIKQPVNGFAMIKMLLVKPTEELSMRDMPSRIRFPSVSRLPKRQKLYADESGDGEDAASELMERYELMKDELEPEFLLARRMEYEFGLLKEMPIHSGMFP